MSGAVTRGYIPRPSTKGNPPTVREALIHLVRGNAGQTSAELALKVGKTTAQVSAHLSVLAAYGQLIRQRHRATGRSAHEFCTWSAPE